MVKIIDLQQYNTHICLEECIFTINIFQYYSLTINENTQLTINVENIFETKIYMWKQLFSFFFVSIELITIVEK